MYVFRKMALVLIGSLALIGCQVDSEIKGEFGSGGTPTPTVTLEAGSLNINLQEGASLSLAILLAGELQKPSNLNWEILSATTGEFASLSGTLDVEPGQKTVVINIDGVDDLQIEGDTTYTLSVKGGAGVFKNDLNFNLNLKDNDNATHFIIIPPTGIVAGGSRNVIIEAQDAFGNRDHSFNGSVTLGASGSVTGAGVVTIVNGQGMISLGGNTAETSTLSLTDSGGEGFDVSSSENLVIDPSVATAIQLVNPTDVVAGNGTTVEVEVVDTYGNRVSETTSVTVNNSGSATGAGVIPLTNGYGSFTLTNNVAELVVLSLTDSAGTGYDVSSTQDVVYSAGAVTQYVIIDPTDGVANGPAVTVTVEAQDVYGNKNLAFGTDVTLNTTGSASGAGVVDIVSGAGTLTLTNTVLETVTLSLTDSSTTGHAVTSTQDLVFTYGAPAKFVILDPTDGMANDTITVTVQAQDAYGNIVANYQDDVTLNTSGSATGGGVVDIINGVGTKDITNTAVETINLTLSSPQGTITDVTSTQDLLFDTMIYTFTVNTTINAANKATYADSIWEIPSGVTVTLDDTAVVTNLGLIVRNGGVLTHDQCLVADGVNCTKINLHVQGDAIVEDGGTITAYAKGYLGGRRGDSGDPRRILGNVSSYVGAAGSHGGRGKYVSNALPPYGDIFNPDHFGEGGFYSCCGIIPGGNGGGIVKLNVDGTLTLNGSITANGENVSSNGGAGGSVNITANILNTSGGTPNISANGGIGTVASGGGGRVAITYTSAGSLNLDSTVLKAYGGNSAAAGTIYVKSTGSPYGSLIVDNNGIASSIHTLTELIYQGANIDLQNLEIRGNASVKHTSITDALLINGTMTLIAGSSLTVPDNFDSTPLSFGSFTSYWQAPVTWFSYAAESGLVEGVSLIEYNAGPIVQKVIGAAEVPTYTNGNWVIKAGEVVTIDTNAVINIASLSVTNGGTLNHDYCYVADGVNCPKVQLNSTGNIVVEDGGIITASGRGYLGGIRGDNGGGGSGYPMVRGNVMYSSFPRSPSHGGVGGIDGNTLAVYDDYTNPTDFGDGGGAYCCGWVAGGIGGGVIRLTSSTLIRINGSITANGENSSVADGGAGGSVYLNAPVIDTTAGTPVISANGGNSKYYGAGGGRIAVYYDSLSGLSISPTYFKAKGGTDIGPRNGGAGTIYYKVSADTYGSMLIDNGGVVSLNEAGIDYAGTNHTFKDFIISGAGKFRHSTINYKIDITGTLNLSGGAVLYIPDNTDSTPLSFGSYTSYWQTPLSWFSYATETGLTEGVSLIEYDTGPIVTKTIGDADIPTYTNGNWVVKAGEVITIDTSSAISIASLSVTSGGTLTHDYCFYADGANCPKIQLNASGSIIVEDGGVISANGKGYLGGMRGDNPSGTSLYPMVRGNVSYSSQPRAPSHGGMGGIDGNTLAVYDDYANPTDFGDGGSATCCGYVSGGNGGGVIRLTSSSLIRVNGSITANGETNTSSEGGAGGSIYLSAPTIESTAGTPLVTANGGNSKYYGAGGGRIAMYYDTITTLSPTPTYFAAKGGTDNYGRNGSAGTIYYKVNADTYGSMLIDNGGVVSINEAGIDYASSDHTFKDFVISGAGKFKLSSINNKITISGDLNLSGGGILYVPNNMDDTPLSFGLFNSYWLSGPMDWFSYAGATGLTEGVNLIEYDFGTLVNKIIDGSNVASYTGGAWVVQNGEIVTIDLDGQINIASLQVQSGGFLYQAQCMRADGANCPKVDLNSTGDIIVEDGGTISAAGRGFLGGMRGDNGGSNGTGTDNLDHSGYYAMSHGGFGGYMTSANNYPIYGDFTNPSTHGVGGQAQCCGWTSGGNGGGVVRLVSGSLIRVNGLITADGTTVFSAVGGAGGSVFLSAPLIESTAGIPLVSANGGGARYQGSGGGRIAVYYNSISGLTTTASHFRAYGGDRYLTGTGSSLDGGAGTVYFKDSADTYGTLLIDNGPINNQPGETFLPVTAATVNLKDLTVDNYARFYQYNTGDDINVTGTVKVQNNGVMSVYSDGTPNDGTFGAWFLYGLLDPSVIIGTNLIEE